MDQGHVNEAQPATHCRSAPCERCGGGIELGRASRKARYCSACREARFVENLTSLMTKQGEPYRRAVEARQRVRDEQRRGGGSVK